MSRTSGDLWHASASSGAVIRPTFHRWRPENCDSGYHVFVDEAEHVRSRVAFTYDSFLSPVYTFIARAGTDVEAFDNIVGSMWADRVHRLASRLGVLPMDPEIRADVLWSHVRHTSGCVRPAQMREGYASMACCECCEYCCRR